MKKFLVFFTLILVVVFTLSYCGKKKSSSGSSNDPDWGGTGGNQVFTPGNYPTNITCGDPLFSQSVYTYIQNTKRDDCIYNTDCRFEGIGNKACGGSSSVLVYSSRLPFQTLNNFYNAIDYYNWRTWQENQVCQLVSDCAAIVLPDKAMCVNNKCQAIYD